MANTRQARANSGNRIALGILIIIVSFFCFLSDVGALGGVGRMVYSFLVGFFGLASYAYSIMGIILGIAVTFNIRPKASFAKALTWFGLLLLAIFALHIYTSSAHIIDSGYGEYLLACYGNTNTAGGMLFGIAAYPLMKLITSVGALVVACAAFFVLGFFALIPTLRRNVTYAATSPAQRGSAIAAARPGGRFFGGRRKGDTSQGTAIDAPSAPVITDLSRPATNGFYVVDVDGTSRRRKNRHSAYGADGYKPLEQFDMLYPNKNGAYEDEQLKAVNAAANYDYRPQKALRTQSEQTDLARQILFGAKPDSEAVDRFGRMNSGNTIEPLNVPFNSYAKTQIGNKLGLYDDAGRLQQEYISKYRATSDNGTAGAAMRAVEAQQPFDPEAYKRQQVDRLRVLNDPEFSATAYEKPVDQKQVVTPARSVARQVNPTAQHAIDSVNQVNVGMLGAVNSAGKERTAPPRRPQEMTSVGYEGYKPKQPIHDAVTYMPEKGTPKMPTAFAGNSVNGDPQGGRRTVAPSTRQGQPMPPRQGQAMPQNGNMLPRQGQPMSQNGNMPPKNNAPQNGAPAVAQGVQNERAQQKPENEVRRNAVKPVSNNVNATVRPADSEVKRNDVKSAANNATGGYTMAPMVHPEATVRPAEVDGKDIESSVPTQPLPVKKPVTGADMSRTALQDATNIAGVSAKDKENEEITARIEGIKKDKQTTPKVAPFERESALREAKMKAAKDKGIAAPKTTERVAQVTIDEAIQQADPKPKKKRPYVAPPVSLLEPPSPQVDQHEDYELKKEKIIYTLGLFNITGEVTEVIEGPTFTMYKLKVEMPRGRTINYMNNIESDIAMKMEVSSVRILAPIPGEDAVGIEVPNKVRRIVNISEIINSHNFNTAKDASTFALGTNLKGEHRVVEVRKLPHVLIAGATGAGKSCCINSLIISMLYKASPDDVRFILIDPKRVELSIYAGIPHLLMDEIICDTDKAIRALNWAVQEMDRRMKFFGDHHYRDIEDYNNDCVNTGLEKMPRIIVVVDEFADLMSTGKKAVEDTVNRLARLARAAGIHLVLATQRPSVDVISGTIKNNFPSRIAFKVTQSADSKTVLDTVGAEKLLGYGDLFFMTPGSTMERMQGAFISNNDVRNVVEFIKQHNDSYFDEAVKDAIFKEEEPKTDAPKEKGKNKSNEMMPELIEALELGIRLREEDPANPCISTSNLQRKLGLGFPKAARLKDLMDSMGYLSPDEKNPRNKYVNISREELEELRNSQNEDGEE